MIITKKVFDPNLVGKGARVRGVVSGESVDEIMLVKSVRDDVVTFIRFNGNILNLDMTSVHRYKIDFLGEKKKTNRTRRSYDQIDKDNKEVVSILAQRQKQMPLQEIISIMNKRGYTHWTENSSSGFIIQAIEEGHPIERVGHGLYQYKGEKK